MLQVIDPTLPGCRQVCVASMRATAHRNSPRSHTIPGASVRY